MNSIHEIFNNKTVRKFLLKFRAPISLALGAVLLTQIKQTWFLPGLVVSAFGALFQLWCFGCIKTQKVLAVNGPYMFMRNPMYIARFFLILGGLMFTGNLWIIGVYVPLYYLYMVNRVKREEVKLREFFGKDYEEYCTRVRRFIPSLKRFDSGSLFFFRWDCFMRNHGLWNLLALLAVYGVCYYFAFFIFH